MELTDNKSNNNNYTYNLDDNNNNSNTNYNFLRDRKIEEELTQSSLPSSFDDYCDSSNNNNINDDENDDDMIIHIPLDEMENNSKHRKRYRAPSPCLEKVLFPMMMSL